MFNGIIFNQGIVQKSIKRAKGINIFVKSNLYLMTAVFHRKYAVLIPKTLLDDLSKNNL